MSDLVSDLGRIYRCNIFRLAAKGSQQIAPNIQRQILALGSSQHRAQHLAVVFGELM